VNQEAMTMHDEDFSRMAAEARAVAERELRQEDEARERQAWADREAALDAHNVMDAYARAAAGLGRPQTLSATQ
jgi:hypothetical protein